MKRSLLTALIALLFAGIAFAESREVDPNLVRLFPSRDQIVNSYFGTVDLDGECLYPAGHNNSNVATVTCANLVMGWGIPKPALITSISVYIQVAGDAGYTCVVHPTANDLAIDAAVDVTLAASAAAFSTTVQPQLFYLAEGDVLKVQVNAGTGGCDLGTNPRFDVTIMGIWLE